MLAKRQHKPCSRDPAFFIAVGDGVVMVSIEGIIRKSLTSSLTRFTLLSFNAGYTQHSLNKNKSDHLKKVRP